MKVNGSANLGSPAAARLGARPAAGGFSVSGGGAAAAEITHAAPSSVMTGVGSLDALLALQEVPTPLERRRKAVRRAGGILDALDDIKIALLDGALSPKALDQLVRAVRQERAEVDDDQLQGLLTEIEARAAVEIAKLEMARAAA